jgi:HK97 family phage major capsid protein
MQLKAETSMTCGDNPQKLRQRYETLKIEMGRILSRSPNGAEMSLSDAKEFDSIMTETKRIGALPDNKYNFSKVNPGESEYMATSSGTWLDTDTGRPIRVLAPHEKISEVCGNGKQKLSIGKLIKGMVTGRWQDAPGEKLAMAEGANQSGGYLFGDEFSSLVIDYARNKSAAVQAGMATIPWQNSDTLNIARIVADPTFAVISENTEIPEQSLTFDMVSLRAKKIACLISASRELMEDAVNCAQIIEQTLSRALAVALDRIALTGIPTDPVGLANYPGVSVGTSTGNITWELLHGAVVAVREGNFEPSAYITSPTIAGALDVIKASTAGVWMGPPPSLKNVPRFETKNAAGYVFAGDFSQLALGIRREGSIELSNQAGTSFAKHQTFIKLVFRGDVAVLNSAAFRVLAGVTVA